MKRLLPLQMGSYVLLFIIFSLFLPFVMLAQQAGLKTQATEPPATQQVTGHNNLRKLANIYDKQLRQAQGKPEPVGDNVQLRRLYEISLLKDPTTGLIPEGIREREMEFAQQLNESLGNRAGRRNARVVEDWKARGPYNVGGRTRALAIDLDNENIIVAGGVSGGMWRSEDGGLSWFKTTGSSEIQSVTAVVQDPRPGFRNTWYYATGERIGNSASAGGAFFGGNGIYKSVDGARSWTLLPFTADNRPQVNGRYDVTFNLAIHPATGDLYAATYWGIHRSTDGGNSFTEVIAGDFDTWTDVIITPGGVIYVTFDSGGIPNKGIHRSTDGVTWTNITPATFPATYGRTVLGYTPTDENIIYVFADNASSGFLWRYTHGAATPWTNLTASIPAFGGSVGNLNTQGGYNMIIKVHPTNPNIVFIGATNLYRSPNGFTSRTGMAWIGGYSPANNVSMYPSQHPDQHALVFYPSDPAKALSGNDGGIQYTDNVLATNAGVLPVLWTSRNNGYLTTQPYTVSFDPLGTGDQLMAGFQDNSTWFTSSASLTTPWSDAFSGDGSYNAFADGGITRYVSSQSGNIYRLNYATADDAGDDYISFTRVTPAGATGFAFVAPFTLDPNNDNMMYLPAGGRMWRNDNLDGIPLFSNAATTANWTNLANSQVAAGHAISALAVSRMPANRLYYGTNNGLIYRIDNANIGDQPKTDIATGKGLPVGNVSCITVDPVNADRVFAVYSNYNVRSIFYSADGGNTWTDISANLEENTTPAGSGPSARWLAIEGNNDRYYVGTSTGLYSTVTLNGASTVWAQEDVDGIGNVVVPMIRTREDGLAVVASHGNGLYSAKFEVTPLPQPTLKVINVIDDFEVFAGSPNTIIDISNVFHDANGDAITYSLINTNPALITASLSGNLLTLSYAPASLGKATIGIVATAGGESVSEPFTVTVRDVEYLLYNQNTAILGTRPSQLFTNFAALAQSADDFTVPAGDTWSIERVLAPGAVNGTPVLNAIRVVIYKDTLGAPGNEVYVSSLMVPASGSSNANLDLTLPAPALLPGGKYWISVYAELAFVSSRQWFWRTTGVVNGTQAHFRDPANLFGVGAINWTAQSAAFGGVPTDMLFTLYGKGTLAAPAAPDNLAALYSSDIKFNLSWNDNATTEIAYLIERSTDGTTFAKRTTVGPGKTSYSDTDLFDPELTYYYRVAAVGISDTSAYSNIASTAVIPDAPVAGLATFILPTFFVANWESAVGASHYELDVSADNFATFLHGFEAKVVHGNYYLVWGTHFKKTYKYRLRAVNAGGKSPNSNEIIVAPVKDLKLAAVCSDNPQTIRRWRITNPNPFDIGVEWAVHKTSQRGSLTVPPGQSYFTTNTVGGSNTTIITWRDDFYIPHIDMKGSTKTRCSGTGHDVVYARYDGEDEAIETATPFIIDAWPNPSRDKFNIMIASPYEDEVEMEILGLKGEKVFSTKTQSNVVVEVDATNYPSGIYLVKAKQLIYHQTLKLVKQ